MGTTNERYQQSRKPVNRLTFRQQIAKQRDVVVDLDVVVDDRRRDVDRSVDELRTAVRERDRAAAHLTHLIELHDEIEAVALTFGPEIGDAFALQLEARG